MTTENAPQSPLDGLLKCGHCGSRMVLDERKSHHQPLYVCNPKPDNGWIPCLTPDLKADDLDDLIIRSVMDTVLTRKNLMNLVAIRGQLNTREAKQQSMTEPRVDDAILTSEETSETYTNSKHFVQTQGGPKEARESLGMFIAEIRADPGKITVHYSIPLSSDSPMSGSHRQEIELPAGILSPSDRTRASQK